MPVDEARKQAALIIDRIKRGEEPVAQPPEGGPTVAGLAERFMRTHVERHLKPASVAAYRTVLEGYILPALGGTGLEEVGGAEVTALHHGLRDTPVLANRAVHLLSRMFVLAEAWELVPPGRNPCLAVRRYRTQARERFLTPEEYRRLGRALRQAEAESGIWLPAIAAIRLLALTGCRRSEVLGLRREDVALEAAELRLPDSKTGARAVPLPPQAVELLASLLDAHDGPWVIPGRKPGTPLRNIDEAWRMIRERVGLEGVRIHDLRHSWASRALALGEALPVIGKLLGHSKMETTARYAHLARDSAQEAAERVAQSIEADMLQG